MCFVEISQKVNKGTAPHQGTQQNIETQTSSEPNLKFDKCQYKNARANATGPIIKYTEQKKTKSSVNIDIYSSEDGKDFKKRLLDPPL